MHTVDSLAAELQRVRDRPGADAAPPVLSLFVIDVHGDAAEYARRLRSAISPAVRLGGTADFEQESLPVDDVPDWFAAVSSQDPEQAPRFARAGCERYAEHTGGGRPWDLQDWLYRFDPDEDSRGWEWWDASPVGPSRVHMWVDSWGSPSSDARTCSGPLTWRARSASTALRFVNPPCGRRSGTPKSS